MAGTLTKILFVNPHGSLTLTVKNPDGTTTDWVFTTGSATTLAQRGISKVGPNALKAGDAITAKFIPARNGSSVGVSQVDYHGGREGDRDLRRQPQ